MHADYTQRPDKQGTIPDKQKLHPFFVGQTRSWSSRMRREQLEQLESLENSFTQEQQRQQVAREEGLGKANTSL